MNSLKEIFEAFKDKTVLVIGDVMIDSYVYGNTQRISPEAPVPVLNVNRKEKRLGGAANVAMNIQALGATPILCSVVGDDKDGEIFERLLHYQGMPNKGIIRSQNRVTTSKLRVLSGSQHLLRIDTEDVHPLVDLDRKSLLHHIKDLCKESDLIIFEDYDKGTIHPEIIQETIKLAKAENIPVAVDPKHQNLFSYKGASLFKPSVKELEIINEKKIDIRLASSLKKVIDELHPKIEAENYLLTLQGEGIYYQSKGNSSIHKSHAREVSDISGVDDTVISIAGLCLTLGLPLEFIAELANIGGGIVSNYPGVVPIARDELLKQADGNQILKKYL